ncbi:MAG: hypothetical protein E7016_07555 [Alphaproteobacteria bacterium]|nr:hypothetical protein [Alphaproteobacteria bacterium]
MTTLIEYGSPFFDKKTAKKLFKLNKQNLNDKNGFEYLLCNSRFFNVHNNGYVGSIFVYEGFDGKKYMGGYALRKHHKEVVEAIKMVSQMFDEVFVHTTHLDAVIALKKAGFNWFDKEKRLLRKITI